jgi:GNAT superfamily N-acetyltransferase
VLRRATEADAAAIARLWAALIEELDPGSPSDAAMVEGFTAYLQRMLGRGELVGVVSEEEGTLNATASAILIEVPPRDGRHLEAYVINVFSTRAVRGQGVGEAVTAQLVEMVERLPVRRVLLRTVPRARGLYQRLGFVDPGDWMLRDLRPRR